jgi:hypothetical protein
LFSVWHRRYRAMVIFANDNFAGEARLAA